MISKSSCGWLLVSLVTLGCGDDSLGSGGGASGGGSATSGTGSNTTDGSSANSSNATTGVGAGTPCPSGVTCVESFPFRDERDTSTEGGTAIASYDCSPATNEGGPEIIYRVAVPQPGMLGAAVYDAPGVDIDVHLLSDFDPQAPSGVFCMSRGDTQAGARVNPGYLWVVADTWINGGGTTLAGEFIIDIGVAESSEGPCELGSIQIPRVGETQTPLSLPATGPLAVAPHYLTQEEVGPFPTSSSDKLGAHFELTQAETGAVLFRSGVWASGGDFFGAGIADPSALPVRDEAYLISMAWTPAGRPASGTRMIVRDPADPGAAVVLSAGYADGPSDLGFLGAISEEAHFYLGSSGSTTLELSVAADQSLPLGPRRCAL